jgi:hypothetical protein
VHKDLIWAVDKLAVVDSEEVFRCKRGIVGLTRVAGHAYNASVMPQIHYEGGRGAK